MTQYQEHTSIERAHDDSLGSWVLTIVLMSIPVVGVIYLILLAIGVVGSHAKKNYARAALIVGLIFAVLAGVFLGIGSSAGWFTLDWNNFWGNLFK